MYLSNPVVVANTLFGLSHRASGQFFALDSATGEVLWMGAPREAANTAVIKAGEWLLLLNDDAELIAARASRRGFEPVVPYTVGDSATWAQPAISGQRLFRKGRLVTIAVDVLIRPTSQGRRVQWIPIRRVPSRWFPELVRWRRSTDRR